MILDLPRQIDPDLAADLEKESAFVSPFLTRLRVTGGRDRVELEIAEPAGEADVQAKVERFLEAMLKRTHRFETKVFLRTELVFTDPEVEHDRRILERGASRRGADHSCQEGAHHHVPLTPSVGRIGKLVIGAFSRNR